MRIGEVACPVPLARTFDYEVPDALRERAVAGVRVAVSFGPRRLAGVLLGVREGEPQRPLKPISAVLDPEPLLSEEQLELGRWLADRYCAPPGECFRALLPVYVKLNVASRGGAAKPVPPAPPEGPPKFQLTPGQARAVDELSRAIDARTFQATLLFGVPASGKTEVYLRLIRQAVSGGGQALFLLPEISLTRPFFEDFSRRAGFPVALWHSQLGGKARREVWLGLRRGEVRVVVGARSACLLPFKDLRFAVLDEEQDESYKQEGQAPLYHTRDVVIERARRCGALVVLGSATPSIETVAAVDAGTVRLLTMPERVARATPPPKVELLTDPPRPGRCVSDVLLHRLRDRLNRAEQSILLVNRRGHSNFLLCRKCGWVARCASCSLAFVVHQTARKAEPEDDGQGLLGLKEAQILSLLCHHCGKAARVPAACGGCKGPALAYSGAGTQKVVAELTSVLPGAKILRMDSDTVAKERSEALQDHRVYDQFAAGKADILVGTKLVAKGFHFPNVTLVGVVDADSMLHMPDFRSAERTLQLLVQVAGRAGRAEKPGEVLLQTASPGHYAMSAVVRGDYLQFARQEMSFRKELDYPPSSTLIRVLVSSAKEEKASEAADAAAESLRSRLPSPACELVGPSPGVYQKLRGQFRHHILLKVKDGGRLASCLEEVRRTEVPSGVKLNVNVDPYDLF